MAAQIIVLALFFADALFMANRHGRLKVVRQSFWNWLIVSCIELGLLYWGGFFDCFIK